MSDERRHRRRPRCDQCDPLSGSVLENNLLVSVPGTFPIDLAKTRLQVQGQVGDSKYREIRYRGMLHAMMRIGREEGPRALYSGSVWAID